MNYSEISKEIMSFVYQARATLSQSPVRVEIRTLAELRTSQINGCAYCCRLHTNEARKIGIPQEKLDLLPAWRHATLFSEEERLTLQWTEAVTRLEPEANAMKNELTKIYSEKQISDLTICIGLMNALNRIEISLNG